MSTNMPWRPWRLVELRHRGHEVFQARSFPNIDLVSVASADVCGANCERKPSKTVPQTSGKSWGIMMPEGRHQIIEINKHFTGHWLHPCLILGASSVCFDKPVMSSLALCSSLANITDSTLNWQKNCVSHSGGLSIRPINNSAKKNSIQWMS